MSETSPVETALRNITSLETSLDELRKKVEARKVELLRLAQEAGESAYASTVKEAEDEKAELVTAVQKSSGAEAAAIVAHGQGEMASFNARAQKSREPIKDLIMQILLSEA